MNVPQGFDDYLEAILWVSGLDNCDMEDFSYEAIAKLSDYYDRFVKSINYLGLRDYYVQAYGEKLLGHDFALEQLRMGCGFMDKELLKDIDRDLLCEIANCFPEFSVYELENGELEVE